MSGGRCRHDKAFIPKIDPKYVGARGCHGMTKRRGLDWRMCAQQADARGFCWYHNPRQSHRFAEGYNYDAERRP